jgi:hypothetical protein
MPSGKRLKCGNDLVVQLHELRPLTTKVCVFIVKNFQIFSRLNVWHSDA